MPIIITGASGQYGTLAVARLLERVPPSDLILITRRPEKLAHLAARGVSVRAGDFDDPASLPSAFSGGEKMLLISSTRVGQRLPQHRAAIDAAVASGVTHIVYTSFIGAEPDNPALVAKEHAATEQMLRGSGVHWTALRDSQYADALADAAAPIALKMGRWISSAGDGKIALIARRDCVACAVAVLTTPGHFDTAYDITGPELLSYREVAAMVASVAEKHIEFAAVTDAELYEHFDRLGIPREAADDKVVQGVPWSSDDMVSFERAIRTGHMAVISGDVKRLTGVPPQSMRDVLREREAMLRAVSAAEDSRLP
jgi:NAD(P)H dehydrogenase (quinone)